ncbi:MAG: Ig-like domain-containing protein [Luteolibacter sp.]
MRTNEGAGRIGAARFAGNLHQIGMAVTAVGLSLLGNAFGAVAAPVLSPVDGDSLAKFSLTLTCPTSGAKIYYTLNGAEPTTLDSYVLTGGTVVVDRNRTVKAKAMTLTEASTTTTAVYTLTGDIAAGGSHALGMTSAGAVSAWGLQTDGRLGNNVTTAAYISTPVASRYTSATTIGDAQMVAAGLSHSVFLKTGGAVYSYGLNTTGALGNNTTTSSGLAVQVRTSASAFLTGGVAVAAGDGFSGALTSSGAVYTWGSRVSGRLGDSATVTGSRLVAGVVNRSDTGAALGGINRIAFGTAFGMAKEPSAFEQAGQLGQVWVWGSNAAGQLGQGNTTDLTRALRVKLSASVYLQDALDFAGAEAHSAIVRWKSSDPLLLGRVLCAGQQQYGRLGNNVTTAATITYPVQVVKNGGVALDRITSVAAGSTHTLALDLDGNVWAWGYNGKGALGNNSTADRGYADKVSGPGGSGYLSNIVRIAAGGTGLFNYSMAVSANGTVYTWGYNGNGQLGNGGTTNSLLPVAVGGSLDLLLPNPPVVTLATAVTAASFPGAVTLTASPTDVDNDISKVEFFCQGSLVGQLTAAPWTINLSNLTEGTYPVYAVVTDSTGLTGYSANSSFTINYDPNAANPDTDGDGLTDSTEAALGLSSTDADTDGDGIPDGIDAAPGVPDTVPLATASTILIWTPAE